MEKDLGILMGEKLDMSQQFDLAAHIFPLYSALMRPQLKVCVQLWVPVAKTVWTCWSSSEEDHENGQRARAPLLWQKAERVAVVQLGEEKAPWRPYCGLSELKGDLTRKRERSFNMAR